jgi:threonine aldolase
MPATFSISSPRPSKGNGLVIDLRSDTVSRPSAAMREAMATAAVGDDGFHDDPTVIALEARAAEIMGKEAGLFMPSGTMSNLVAALTHCPAGREVLLLEPSHIEHTLSHNQRIGGLVRLRRLPIDSRGLPAPSAVQAAIERAPIGLVCYENTHNMAGGAALSLADTAELTGAAHDAGIPVHLDGARLFNAVVALDTPAAVLASQADSVTFCLSKGLGAPVGSVLCGTDAFIDAARDYRQYLGGTMRQAGAVAAAGLLGLNTMVDRLADDHANARYLAAGLKRLPGIRIINDPIETNLIFIDIAESGLTAAELEAGLNRRGVVMDGYTNGTIKRAATHVDISRADCETVIAAFAAILDGAKAPVPV